MDHHDSTTEGTIASGKGFLSTDAGRDTAGSGRPDSAPIDEKGSFRPWASSIPSSGQAPGPGTEQEGKPSISARKLAANRRNAKLSTGPKTPKGKESSSRNAYKLGIFARQLFSPTEQGLKEWEAYQGIATRIYAHYRPEGVMEEILVDKVVTETIRLARLLSYERQELSRKGAFWDQSLDRVLRYQTAINRQLARAIEQLEQMQAERKDASGISRASDDTEPDAAADEPCELPGEPVPGDEQQLTPAASDNRLGALPVPVEPSIEAMAARPPAPAPGEASSRPAGIPNSGPQQTEKYKTNPPSSSSGGEISGAAHKAAGQKCSLVDITERVAGLSAPRGPNNRLVPKSDIGTKSNDAPPYEPSDEDILECL